MLQALESGSVIWCLRVISRSWITITTLFVRLPFFSTYLLELMSILFKALPV